MSEIAIQATEVSMEFGPTRALDDVNLSVASGTVLAILGPNGAGKTTFARLAGGLLEPTEGTLTVLGVSARSQGRELAGRVVSVGDNQNPPRWSRIVDLIALQADASPNFDKARALALCEDRDLNPKQAFGALSKGQKRWVLSVLALAAGTEVVFMDEPADGLDPAARRALYDMIRDAANEQGTTFVIATHIIGDIERVADEAAILQKGRLLLHASLEDLREQVRQIETPHRPSPADLGDGADVLAERQIDGATLTYVRARPDSADAVAPSSAIVRPVGLEELFLAITKNQANGETVECQFSKADC